MPTPSRSLPVTGCFARCLATAALLALPALDLSALAGRVREMPDQILVKTTGRITDTHVAGMLRPVKGRHLGTIHQIGVRVLRVPAAHRDATLLRLQNDPDVEFAECDAVVEPDFTPNDTYYASQWHLPKIGAPAAWDITVGSSDVIVAIIDSGVDASHPDFTGRLVAGWNFYNNNSDTSDVYGHGTSVAGTAIANGNDGTGVAGVAWQARIMPIRVSSTTGSATYSAMAQGLTFAADNGARVANLSFGGASRSATVQSAATYFASKGGLTVVATGNDGLYYNVADHPDILAVTATGSTDALATYSSQGPFVDLSAPGSSLYAPALGGGYRTVSGTSFAAPVVAGVAALVLSVNPDLTPAEVEAILKQSATDLGTSGYDTGYGYGRVNAHQAVLAALPAGTDLTAPTVTINSPANGCTVSGQVTVQVAAQDETAFGHLEVYVDGDLVASQTTGTYSAAWNTTTETDGQHTITAVAYDAAGNSMQAVSTVTVANLRDTTAPTVCITSPRAGTVVGTKTQKVTVSATDASGIAKVSLYANSTLIGTILGNTTGTYAFTWNTSRVARGTYTLTAVATDTAGNCATSAGVAVVR